MVDGGADRRDGGWSPTETYGIGLESSDDSATATLESMGYIDDETEVSEADGEYPGSGFSVLQWIIIALVAVIGVYTAYAAVTSVLATFGIYL